MFDLSQIDVKTSIGKTGFEPATPWSQTKYSTKLSYFPNNLYLYHIKIIYSRILDNLDAPCRIRTCNRLIRSQVLYPVEPRVLLYPSLCKH